MPIKKILFTLTILCLSASGSYAQVEKLPVKYLNAADVINMAKASAKPYLWVSIYVPKCANASSVFKEDIETYNKIKDKADLIILSVVKNNDNIDSIIKFSNASKFTTPFYVIDTMYIEDNLMEIHFKFTEDLNKKLGVKNGFSKNIILNKKGTYFYKSKSGGTLETLYKKISAAR